MSELYRVGGTLNLNRVRQMTVVVVGLGSLGSQAIMHLAYPWGRLVLIDPEKLEVENVERHLLGYPDVGRYKVTGVKRWLVNQRRLDPSRIVTHRLPVTKALGRYPNADLIIEATGIPSVKRLVNHWAVINAIPAIYGGVYAQGVGGQTVAIIDPRQSCLGCINSFDGDDGPLPDYGSPQARLDPETGEVSEAPYLSGAVASIAADIHHYVRAFIAGEELPNQIMLHLHEWEPIKQVSREATIQLLEKFKFEAALGLLPNQRVMSDEAGTLTLEARRDKLPHNIRPSAVCQFHFEAAAS